MLLYQRESGDAREYKLIFICVPKTLHSRLYRVNRMTFFWKKNFPCHRFPPCLVPDVVPCFGKRLNPSRETCVGLTDREWIMLKFFIRQMILKFGKRYDYDVDYMLHMLDRTPEVMSGLNALSKLSSYRKKAPLNAHMAARLQGVLMEDCGPCVQLTVDMALEAGMARDEIEAVLTGDPAAMAEDTALGYRFASAILARSPDQDDVREAVRAAYGDEAVIEITLATQVSRFFPMIKTGLGYGKSCSMIVLGERKITMSKEAA